MLAPIFFFLNCDGNNISTRQSNRSYKAYLTPHAAKACSAEFGTP